MLGEVFDKRGPGASMLHEPPAAGALAAGWRPERFKGEAPQLDSSESAHAHEDE